MGVNIFTVQRLKGELLAARLALSDAAEKWAAADEKDVPTFNALIAAVVAVRAARAALAEAEKSQT